LTAVMSIDEAASTLAAPSCLSILGARLRRD
jgi:hypothetical protein